ncbi:hypothetical protein L7F22_056592 [Adiantum nelumboides]|nr:hypothetical protein [Adiantum nelumboides]
MDKEEKNNPTPILCSMVMPLSLPVNLRAMGTNTLSYKGNKSSTVIVMNTWNEAAGTWKFPIAVFIVFTWFTKRVDDCANTTPYAKVVSHTAAFWKLVWRGPCRFHAGRRDGKEVWHDDCECMQQGLEPVESGDYHQEACGGNGEYPNRR